MVHRLLLASLMVLTACVHALAAKDRPWFEVSSEHFLLFTDTTEAKGRRLLADFEARVAALSQAFGKVPPRQFPIEVFLFDNEQDYIEAMPRAQGEERLTKSGYLFRGPDRVFVVAKDKSPEDIANDVGHAIGHVFFERYVMWRPFWLAEGAAEYFRKVGRSPDTKTVSDEDGFSASDLITIRPSATYNDNEPGGPFRIQSHRLLRIMIEEQPDLLKEYFRALRAESETAPVIPVDREAAGARLKTYVETAIKAPPVAAVIKSGEAQPEKLSVHRGDLFLASDRKSEAARWYDGDTREARAARAVLVRFIRPPGEAVRVLDRAARELPEDGLVQFHFGAIEIPDKKDVPQQLAALERATQLLPRMGRAYAELARLYAATGQPGKSFPLVDRALELEPEFADRYYEIRADARVAASQYDEAFRDIRIASELPHAERSAVEQFTLKVSAVRRRIENARREIDAKRLEEIRSETRAEAERREPPPKPAPPPPPVPTGSVRYEIETRAPLEVVETIYPDYPEALRKKGAAGAIVLRVDIGPDGKVRTATIEKSQFPEMDAATIDAVKKWLFKPGNRNIRLFMTYSLQ